MTSLGATLYLTIIKPRVTQIRDLLRDEQDPIDRHFMLAELGRCLYRCRDAHPDALADYDDACRQHDLEIDAIRPALLEKFGVVPLLDLYRQAAVRCQKSRDWETMRWWAERGIAVYGDQSARPEYLADLQKRASYAISKLVPKPSPAPTRHADVGQPEGSKAAPLESLTCISCGATFQRSQTRGRKPHHCRNCRDTIS
jgi:hypothetical protein